MHTTGTAVIRVQPDKVTLRLGVQTFGATPREAQAKNARIVEAVLQSDSRRGRACVKTSPRITLRCAQSTTIGSMANAKSLATGRITPCW